MSTSRSRTSSIENNDISNPIVIKMRIKPARTRSRDKEFPQPSVKSPSPNDFEKWASLYIHSKKHNILSE